METQDYNLEKLSAAVTQKLARSSRLAFLVSIILMVLSLAWLVYTVITVQQLRGETQKLEKLKEKLDSDIVQQQQKVNQLKVIQKRMMRGFGVLSSTVDSLFNDDYFASLPESVFNRFIEADSLRRLIAGSSSPQRRQAITVQHFPKDVDAEIVEAALKELGFKYQFLPGSSNSTLADSATNAIWFSQNVDLDDAKLVAYTLMRANVKIRAIMRFGTVTPRSVIQVGTTARLYNVKPLTIEEVRLMSEY